ncbi:hypothetical protein SESBI_40595 [Sesbania bispinosa]|nr:hypothetical protein SESBI_40595 [Sesbania bispinosa]
MWPATSTHNPSFFFFPSNTVHSFSHRPLYNPPPPTPFRRPHLSASISRDDFNGWALLDTPARPTKTDKGILFPSYAIVGVGTSLALLVALFANFSLSRKGFKIQFTSPLQGIWSPIGTHDDQNNVAELDASNEATPEDIPVSITETVTSEATEKLGLVTIPVYVDSTQEEALSVLKKLKIIEDDVGANDLCTRREFARWLVKLNSSLERNPKHRIAPIVSLSGSVVTAFDDISVEDPDFRAIQALAEAGVFPSKLSWKNSFSYGGSDNQENIKIFPDRFISRQDLIDWRAQLEYEFFSGLIDQMSIKKTSYMDVKEITSPAVYMDMLAGDRRQSKRFQPNKPSTKAQAAVALTSGRMKEAISSELSRIEAENSARQAEAEEIRSELLSRGDIQKFWDEKLSEEKNHGFDVERFYHEAVSNLEEEKINQDKINAEYLKEKAAMDCQKQLLVSLKKEVDEISEKLESERAEFVDEKHIVQKLLKDLEFKHEQMLDTKSTLEAEKEALQILRKVECCGLGCSVGAKVVEDCTGGCLIVGEDGFFGVGSWVEDEARRSQGRAAVLEEVGRRWKWDDQA